jgi:hypothetical protein
LVWTAVTRLGVGQELLSHYLKKGTGLEQANGGIEFELQNMSFNFQLQTGTSSWVLMSSKC